MPHVQCISRDLWSILRLQNNDSTERAECLKNLPLVSASKLFMTILLPKRVPNGIIMSIIIIIMREVASIVIKKILMRSTILKFMGISKRIIEA